MRIRRGGHRSHTRTHSGGTRTTGYGPVSGAKITTTTPSSTTDTTSESPAVSTNVPTPSPPSGSPGMIMVLALILMLVVEWDNFFKPFLITVWVPTAPAFKPKTPWQQIAGMVAAIAILSIVAELNEDVAGLILLLIIGAWIVFFVENGNGFMTNLIKFFNSGNPHGAVIGGGATQGSYPDNQH